MLQQINMKGLSERFRGYQKERMILTFRDLLNETLNVIERTRDEKGAGDELYDANQVYTDLLRMVERTRTLPQAEI
ncbi:hypothetical protein HYT24_00720, partial [Candidatus Pacearchaeota archaeon]|nr:hypothetical protein [Candidatus Pacearchaeota archaeon]